MTNRLEQTDKMFAEYILKSMNLSTDEESGLQRDQSKTGLYMSTTNGFFDLDRYDLVYDNWYDDFVQDSLIYTAEY